jgi:hypothetical protein
MRTKSADTYYMTYSVSFVLPSGYRYGDGSSRFTVSVEAGDSVLKGSIPVIPASKGEVFRGWETGSGSGAMVLTREQIANQPVTANVDYTAVFEKKASGSRDGKKAESGSNENKTVPDSPASAPIQEKSKRGVTPKQAPSTSGFNVNKPLGGGSVTSDASSIHVFGAGVEMIFTPTANNNAARNTALKDAVNWLAANGDNKDWVMYLPYTGTSYVYYPTTNVSFSSLSSVRTLAITGNFNDPVGSTADDPTTAQPAAAQNTGGYSFLSESADINFGCNVILRNISYAAANIYMNGHDITLGHYSFSTSASFVFGGAASGTVSGSPTITVYSTNTNVMTFVGGMRVGTLNGNAAINVRRTGNGRFNVFGAGYGTGTAAANHANLNGTATTTITGMATSTAVNCGLGTFAGGVQYGDVSGKITNTISGPGRFYYNFDDNDGGANDAIFRNSFFMGGSRNGDIGSASTRGSTIIESNVDTSGWVYGQGPYVGTNTDEGTVNGNIKNTIKAGDYKKGSFSGVSFGSGMNAGTVNNAFDYSIFNVSWNASTGTLHIPGVAAARASAEQKFPYRLYGNLTNNIRSGCVYSTWDWERHVRGAGYGYVEGNATTNVGTEGLVYSGTHRTTPAMWNVNSRHYKYAADPNYANNTQGNRAGLEFAGGGGWPTGPNSIFLVGDTELNIYETVANWVYGSNFGGEHIGNAEVNLYGGICDTLEGGSHRNYVRVGNTRATVHGGQVDWFLSGGGWDDRYTIGDASVEVFDSDYDPVNHPVIINASMGGTYGYSNTHVYTGNADITVHGGDFSGAARDRPRSGFSPGPTNGGYILGDATMTLDLRGNKNGFKLAAGDTVSAARRYEANGNPVLGKDSSNSVTLNVFADAGAGDLLKGLNIYGDAAAGNAANTRAGKMTINVNAPGATIGNLYASRYSNLNGNNLRRDVTINLVSAKEVEGITSCGPNDNITNTVAAATANKAVINIGPQPEPAGWDSRPVTQGGNGEWPLTNHEPGLASNGFPQRIDVIHNGIRNFTQMSVDDRLIIAESGGILNGKDATPVNHRSAYDSFGDVTLKDESGLGVNSGDFIAGKLVVNEDGFVASPGRMNQVVFSDVEFKDAHSNLTWLRTPYVGSGSMPATTGMSTDWFNVTEGWPVITLNTGQTGTAGKTNSEKLTPANFKGQDIIGGKTYIGDTDTHYTSGDPDRFSGYGVCIAGSQYRWEVVPGSDGSSLGKISYDIVNNAGQPASGSVSLGVNRPSATNPYIDVYGTTPRNTPTTYGAIAIPASKSLYGKFAFIPDAASGEWANEITVGRSDRYTDLENPPRVPGKGLYDYHEFEQNIQDYYDTSKRTREWRAAASGRPTGSYRIPPVTGALPSGKDDKDYSFDITADYTNVPELNARSVILRESDARALVADSSGNPKSDAEIVAAVRGAQGMHVEGRPFLTDDIVPSNAFTTLSVPLAPNEHSRMYVATYYTHNVNSNATSGNTVTASKTRRILVVPDHAQVTTDAALVAYDADMLVKDAQAITAQRGDSTQKNNIDYWTDAHAYIISPTGTIQETHPILSHASAKIAVFQGTTSKRYIDLTYEFTSPPPYDIKLTETVTAKIVGAIINGTLWADMNGNGSIDSSESDRFIGKNVKLYGYNGVLIDSAITDAYGMYSFGAYGTISNPNPEVPEGNLYIVFPDLSSYGMTTHGGDRRQNLTVNYSTPGQYDYRGAAGFNGGYKWPDTAGLANSFSKQVYDAASGSYVDNLKITDSNTILQYRMRFTLPNNLSGYGSLAINDLMPAGLVYASGETDPFVIRVGGSGPSDGTPYAVSSAGIIVDPSHRQVSYRIVDFSNLAGKTVNVYIKAALAKVGASYPSAIENRGQLVLNTPSAGMGSELTASDPLPPGGLVTGGAVDKGLTGPAISNFGVISGSAFDDANKNAVRDSAEAGIGNVGIELYVKKGGSYILTDSAVTAADGSYRFDVPVGTYRVDFETPLTAGQTTKNITTTPPNDAGADGKTGDIVVSLTSAANQHKVANAGYAVLSNDPPVLSVHSPVEIQKGGAFATMAGVTATDTEDGNLTANVRLSSGSAVVDTNTVGRYHLVYEVTDSDGNQVTEDRIVVVNDGTFVVNPAQNGHILRATSFVTKLDDVATNGALLDDEIKGKSDARLFDGRTGTRIDAVSVENAGGYHRSVGEYNITIAGIDANAPQGRITKGIVGKVVDASVITGPSNPATNGAVYYAYGKDLNLTVAEAAALNTDTLLLDALKAHADKVMPVGTITDAGVRIKSVAGPAASPNAFSSAVGTYNVTIADSANPEHITAVLRVFVSVGQHPVLSLAPVPLVFQTTTAAASLTTSQIMSGVTATDAEDDADTTGTRHTVVTLVAITASGQAISSVPADRAGVYKATYKATDSDGNTDVESRAVIVNDGSISIGSHYALQAKSFIIGLSEVNVSAVSAQIKDRSETNAWESNGNHTDSFVSETGGYGNHQTGRYFPKVAVTHFSALEKRIEARVVDDADFSYSNGSVYSILANRFRINLADAAALAANSGSASYGAEFISRATATGFDRTGSDLVAVANSVTLDGAVVKKNGPAQGRDFSAAGFADGDVYLATFSVIGEPGTKVTVEVLVSSANPPQLFVPPVKQVGVGAAFPEGARADSSPSYMQGVSATDIEDGAISPSAISHNTPVDTTTDGAFLVEYTVTDSDQNTVTQGGVVLVGGWLVVSGYAVMAHDFSKDVGYVQGTDAEIISESAAKAIDLRQTLAGGGANPNYGKSVPVKVENNAYAGDYRAKKIGSHDITIYVDDPSNPASRTESTSIVATIGRGGSPVITFDEAPLVVSQASVSSIMSGGEIKSKLQVTDAEDYPTWSQASGPQQPIFNNMTYRIYHDNNPFPVPQIDKHNIGVYKVEYTATDSHGNQTTEIRAIVVDDGRYTINDADNGGIIIGARDFVIKKADVQGTMGEAERLSFAEAYDIVGNKINSLAWTGAPSGYAPNAPVGDYVFVWTVAGHITTKSIVGKVTGATVVDPGTKDSHYALVASDFLRNTAQAAAMIAGNLDSELISAANVQVIKLLASAQDMAPRVVQYGDALSGPFAAAQNTYPIQFGVVGMPDSAPKAVIDAVINDGNAPVLTVDSPLEVQKGSTFTTLAGVDAHDVEDGHITANVAVAAGSDVVDTNAAGIYKLTYEVSDSDLNKVTAPRVVVVNDGRYVVNPHGRIFEAHSFVAKLSDVTTDSALINSEIKSRSGSKLYDGNTGTLVDMGYVEDSGGYRHAAGSYRITVAGIDVSAASGRIAKNITGKVVDAGVIVGPSVPGSNGEVYYAYGNDLSLTVGEAAALNTDALLLAALNAHTDKVYPDGTVADAGVRVKAVAGPAASPSSFSSAAGTYEVTIADSANPEHVTAKLTVHVSTGNPPVLSLVPIPLEYQATGAAVNLTAAQIMSGATATDIEDDADPNKHTTVTVASITASGQAVSFIPADSAGVYKVTYRATDSDGNEDTASRAVVVNDGSMIADAHYILQAKPFVIGLSEVSPGAVSEQILTRSNAVAWDTHGDLVQPHVSNPNGYGANAVGDYFPRLIPSGHPALEKQIHAKVVDDSGTRGNNGSIYSIIASDFRINLADAAALAGRGPAGYAAEMIARAAAEGYIRTGNNLSSGGTVELSGAVTKKDNPGQGNDFRNAGFANGDVYLATFRIAEEPGTEVTINITVSNSNPPSLVVPAYKSVPVGAAFPEGAYADTQPSYMQGVSAHDIEDGAISPSSISHNNPVSTATNGAFLVEYSVTDSDHNTVTQGGMVLVGGWLTASGYAIIAHDFTKQVGDVQSVSDTDAQIISESHASAIDVRRTLPSGAVNPDFGKQVPVKVKSDGGYSSKIPAEYDVELMVDDPSNQASNAVVQGIKAKIDAGSPPTITFTEEPLMVSQSAVSHIMTEMDIKSKMQVTDPDDNPTWEASDTNLPIFMNPVTSGATGLPYGTSYEIRQGGASGTQVPSIDTRSVGVYRVNYTAIDSHGNKVEKSRAIVVTDGRYIVDKNDDIIIGARGFVIARNVVDGSEAQAKGRSYAEAFNFIGDQLPVKWTGIPTMVGNPGVSYAGQAQVGDYIFTWKVDGHTVTKAVKGVVTDATVVDPGTKDSKYAIMASDFTKTTFEARAMVSSGDIASALIAAANARVVKLVDAAPDAVIGMVSNGTPLPGGTGPFSPTPNTYPIRFGLAGHSIDELKAIINGVVQQGNAPTLTASTPIEIWAGAAALKPASAILPADWAASNGMYGVTAFDQEDGDITTSVAIAAGSDTVDATAKGIYKLTYTVTDSDGSTVTVKRVVVVNDGSYAIGRSRILTVNSFEISKIHVATSAALKEAQIKGLSGATLYDGVTGNVIDDTAVRNDGGYTNAAGEYNITMGGRDPQEPSGWITKPIIGKVVDNNVLVGPQGPSSNGDIYYVRGDHIEITSAQARALSSDSAIMNALNAAADKVSPSGQVTDAGRKLVSVAPSKSALQSGQIGIYSVVISDAASPYNATGTFTIRVVSGNAPSISAPNPIVIPIDPSASGNVGRNSIMAGVTASDVEDGDLTGSIVINPDSGNNERFPSIPANKEGVYQVTFFVEDSDGNQDSITRAVVMDGGSVIIGAGYILQARSFFIGLSEVTTTDAAVQILDRSDAKAWDANGATIAAIVQSTGSYGAAAGDYFPVISVQGQPSIYKPIQATVVDDSNTKTQNGDRYSIAGNNFRINLGTAATWQQLYGTAQFEQLFIANANAVSYLRTGTLLTPSGQVELDGLVVKKSNPSIRFESAALADGDIYLATFKAKDEPNTKVTVEVLVSNANRPVLTVPNHKVVSLGAAFPEGAYADTNPSYMQGVMATDIEDGSLAVTHNTPVDTTTEGAFLVTYSTTDSDNNNVTKAGMVLVGSWSVTSGYAIIAHDFTKRVGQVTGTSGEAISYARARAIDLRATVNGQPNPRFGDPVAVTVSNLGGYRAAVGSYRITYAVSGEPSCSIEKDALVVASGLPSLTVPGMKKIASGQSFDENTTNPSYMSGVSATDPEDGNITANVTHDYTVVPGVDGAYNVTYGVTDSDGNLVTKAGIVLVGDWKDGSDYAIIAHDFSKAVGQVTGTDAEMIGSAMAEAVCINPANPDFGKSGTVTVDSDGGYSSRTVGIFRITFATSEDSTARTTITATVGGGGMPTLNVPSFRQVNKGAAFGEPEYMSGVSASDPEDGDITANVSHTSTVNTGAEGFYAVDYHVADSDGNAAHGTTIVLVGAWTVKNGYAINANDFSKRASQVSGTESEMKNSARVQAVCVEPSDPSFGRAVPVSVTDDGGYPSKAAGSYHIVFGVQADLSVTKTIKATVTRGVAPVLTVPPVRISPQYAGFNYMQGVGASDTEDGDITVKVIYNSTVNTNEPGAYRVTYSVTDSDGNIAYKNGLALVGYGWTEKGGYAIYAQDFAKKLSEITGTPREAMRLSNVQAVWTANQSALDFGKYVPVAIKDAGGYKKKAGNYDMVFAVAGNTSVAQDSRASISDDSEKAPSINVTERNTNTKTTVTQPAPNVSVNVPPPVVQQPGQPAQQPDQNLQQMIVATPEAVLANPAAQASMENATMTDIDAKIPRANGVGKSSWSLIDLLLAIGSLSLGIYLLIAAIRRKGEDGDDGDGSDSLKNEDNVSKPGKDGRDRQTRMRGQLGILLGIASVIILLLTQRFDGEFIIADLWTILFGLIFSVEVLATLGVKNQKDNELDEGQDA